ncbi:single-stranded DNA-binding protein [Rhodococcus sp. IEGM1300]
MSYNQNNNNNGQNRDNGHLYTFMATTILGRLTRDPETKTNNGGTFHEFSVAVNHQNGETSFVDISVNEKNTFLAGKIQYLTKGRNIMVTGILSIKPKGEGKIGSYVSLRPDHIQFVDNPNAGSSNGAGQQQQQQAPQQTPFSGGQPQQQYAPQGQPQQQYAPQGQQQQQYAPQGQPQQQQYAPQGQPQQGYAPQQGAFPQGGQAPFAAPQGAPQQNPFAGAPGARA